MLTYAKTPHIERFESSNVAGSLIKHCCPQMVQKKLARFVLSVRLKKQRQLGLFPYGLQAWDTVLCLHRFQRSLPNKGLPWTEQFFPALRYQLLHCNVLLACPFYSSFPYMTALLFLLQGLSPRTASRCYRESEPECLYLPLASQLQLQSK